MGKGEGNFCGGLVWGGEGNGWESFWESWEGNFDGGLFGGGEGELWRNYLGLELCWGSGWSDETRRDREKRDKEGAALY